MREELESVGRGRSLVVTQNPGQRGVPFHTLDTRGPAHPLHTAEVVSSNLAAPNLGFAARTAPANGHPSSHCSPNRIGPTDPDQPARSLSPDGSAKVLPTAAASSLSRCSTTWL